MELRPSGSAEKYYFVYGRCSELHFTINKNSTDKFRLCVFLYDEFKREYCSLEFKTAGLNTVKLIKRINHITEYEKEFSRNFRETYKEVKECLLQYLPECIYNPYDDIFKTIVEKFLTVQKHDIT